MASLPYTTVDVFTKTKYAGNPLAIVHLPSSTTLTQEQKQIIAREFNYSETVFLHPAHPSSDDIPTHRLDIFTITEELPFAGHPTIGTAHHVLSSLYASSSSSSSSSSTSKDHHLLLKARFEIKAGLLSLSFNPGTGVAKAKIPHNVHIHTSHGLTASDILTWQPGLASYFAEHRHKDGKEDVGGVGVELVSPVLGMNFVMVALPSLEALAAVGTAGARFTSRLDEGWEVGPVMVMFYVRLEKEDEEGEEGEPGVVRLRTRMIEGGFEDPATGSASVGLAALLALRGGWEGRTRFEFVQGVEMGRRSEIGLEVLLEGDEIREVELSGSAVEVMQGRVFYE